MVLKYRKLAMNIYRTILEQFLAPTADCGSGFRFSVTKMKSGSSICWFIRIQLSLLAFFTFVFKLLAC